MIIKIDIDDDIDPYAATDLANCLIVQHQDGQINPSITSAWGTHKAKITHISKSGNIFIHVSKVDEKMPANDITAG